MTITAKITNVGRFSAAGTFKTPDGREFDFPARRELIATQEKGDILSLRVQADEKTPFKVGDNLTLRIETFKNIGGIGQVKGVLV